MKPPLETRRVTARFAALLTVAWFKPAVRARSGARTGKKSVGAPGVPECLHGLRGGGDPDRVRGRPGRGAYQRLLAPAVDRSDQPAQGALDRRRRRACRA